MLTAATTILVSRSLSVRVLLANRSSFLITWSSSTLSIFIFLSSLSSRIHPVHPLQPSSRSFHPKVDCGLSKRRHLLSNASLQDAIHLDSVRDSSGAHHTFNPSICQRLIVKFPPSIGHFFPLSLSLSLSCVFNNKNFECFYKFYFCLGISLCWSCYRLVGIF